MEIVLITLIIQGLVFGFFCSYIAKEKNRDGTGWFWLGFLFSILSVFALIAVPKIDKEKSTSKPMAANKSDLDIDKRQDEFAGERNVASASYQLFLTKRYAIEKNATLEKYVIGDNVFNTLQDSLQEADRQYSNFLIEREAKVEERRLFNQEIQRKNKLENAARIAAAKERSELELKLAPIKLAKIKRNIAISMVVIIPVAIAFWFFNENLNEELAIVDAKENSVEEYEQFLNNYPNSAFSSETQSKLNRLKKYIYKSGTKFEVERYLAVFPNSEFAADAKKRLAELSKGESKQ